MVDAGRGEACDKGAVWWCWWGGRRAFQWSGTIYRLDSGRHSQRSARVVGYHLKPEPDAKARQGAAPHSRGQGWAGVRVLWRVAGLVLAVVVVCVAKGHGTPPKDQSLINTLAATGQNKTRLLPEPIVSRPVWAGGQSDGGHTKHAVQFVLRAWHTTRGDPEHPSTRKKIIGRRQHHTHSTTHLLLCK